MADKYYRTNYVPVPGPDGVTLDAFGPDLHGHALDYVIISDPFFIGMTEKVMIRAYGTDIELDAYKHEPQVQEIPEPAVEAQLRAHTGSDKFDGKVKQHWKVRE